MPRKRFTNDGSNVEMATVNGGTHTVATCYTESWAIEIAKLLESDWQIVKQAEQKVDQ